MDSFTNPINREVYEKKYPRYFQSPHQRINFDKKYYYTYRILRIIMAEGGINVPKKRIKQLFKHKYRGRDYITQFLNTLEKMYFINIDREKDLINVKDFDKMNKLVISVFGDNWMNIDDAEFNENKDIQQSFIT